MTDFKKHYPVSLMESVLLTVGYDGEPMKIPTSIPALATARAFLPYCLTPLAGNRFIILNRQYKPLGVSNYILWVDYDEPQYQSLVVPVDSIDASTLTRNENDSYYFFNDGNDPLSRGSRKSDKEDYLYRLWLVFYKLGISNPSLSDTGQAIAKRLGVTTYYLDSPLYKEGIFQ